MPHTLSFRADRSREFQYNARTGFTTNRTNSFSRVTVADICIALPCTAVCRKSSAPRGRWHLRRQFYRVTRSDSVRLDSPDDVNGNRQIVETVAHRQRFRPACVFPLRSIVGSNCGNCRLLLVRHEMGPTTIAADRGNVWQREISRQRRRGRSGS
jgi:hypothetical protein